MIYPPIYTPKGQELLLTKKKHKMTKEVRDNLKLKETAQKKTKTQMLAIRRIQRIAKGNKTYSNS